MSLKIEYWKRKLQEGNFKLKFITWLLRTISEGVDIGYKGEPRNHSPPRRGSRTTLETQLLAAQYAAETKLGRVVDAGKKKPGGKWFPRFFVSPTYTIPKKKVIGQPQKWRLIHNLSSHVRGHAWSINAGINRDEFPVTYPTITTAALEIFCKSKLGAVLWGRDLKAYYRHLIINPAYWWCTGTVLENNYYVDCYCPFGARSMPAVFQRLSDAIGVFMLQNIPVDGLLGKLDDLLGITGRRVRRTRNYCVEVADQPTHSMRS